MDGEAWAQLGANILGMAMATGAMLASAWGAIQRAQEQRARKAISDYGVVTQKIYDHDALQTAKIMGDIVLRLERVERYDIKLGVLEERVGNVQDDLKEIKSDVKGLDSTITKAILRVGTLNKSVD